jgi:NADH:ubiquinone oxidoreductase subunit 2 (subunit N)
MEKLNRRLGAVGAAFVFGGIMLMYGAVGGMENPDLADQFWAQVATAAVGAMWAVVGLRLLKD